MRFENGGARVTMSDIERVERLVGCPLPAPYREFLPEQNGGTPRPSGLEIVGRFGPETECVQVLHSINRAGGNDLETAIRSDRDERQDHEQFEIPREAIWIGKGMAAEIVLFVEGLRAGQVWLKARVEDHNKPMEGMTFVASTFDAFLSKLTLCEWDPGWGEDGAGGG